MRLVILASLSAFAAAAITLACSSSAPPADSSNDEEDSGDTSTTTPPATTTTPTTIVDTDGSTIIPPAGTVDAGSQCITGSQGEVEPNDTTPNQVPWPAAATAVNATATGSYCGVIAATADTQDQFGFTIVRPATAGAFTWHMAHTGAVTINCTANGNTFNVDCGSSNCYFSQSNIPYVCTITSQTPGVQVDYRVDIKAVNCTDPASCPVTF